MPHLKIAILEGDDLDKKQANIRTLASAHLEWPRERVRILSFIVCLSSGYARPIIDVEVADN